MKTDALWSKRTATRRGWEIVNVNGKKTSWNSFWRVCERVSVRVLLETSIGWPLQCPNMMWNVHMFLNGSIEGHILLSKRRFRLGVHVCKFHSDIHVPIYGIRRSADKRTVIGDHLAWLTVLPISKLNWNVFCILWSRKYIFYIMKINNFWGDVADISAKKEALELVRCQRVLYCV